MSGRGRSFFSRVAPTIQLLSTVPGSQEVGEDKRRNQRPGLLTVSKPQGVGEDKRQNERGLDYYFEFTFLEYHYL